MMKEQLKEIEIPFGAKDSELCGWEYTIPEGMEATIVDNKIVIKKKESEGERMKKIISDILLIDSDDIREILNSNDVLMQDVNAWLEKQSTPQVRTGLEWVNTIDDACDKRYSEEYAHGEYCHEQSFKWGFQEGVEWLEKQGEQKTVDEIAKEVCKDKVSAVAFLKSAGIMNEKGELAEQYRQDEQKPVNIDYISGIREELLDIENNAENIVGLTESQWVAIRAAHRLLGEYIAKEQKPAWSEEDEKIYNRICDIVHAAAYANYDVDEDGKECGEYAKITEWFKSLKERYTWKPSGAQMKQLGWIAEQNKDNMIGKELMTLYNDLKKLRGE